MKHISAAGTAKKWGSADGTQKLGNKWAPPIGMPGPIDGRIKAAGQQKEV